MKKFFALILALCVVLSCTAALADELTKTINRLKEYTR